MYFAFLNANWETVTEKLENLIFPCTENTIPLIFSRYCIFVPRTGKFIKRTFISVAFAFAGI
jgi:hypothetical protein